MKKRRIFSSVFAVLIVILATVVWINSQNIRAIYLAFQYSSSEDIKTALSEKEQKDIEKLTQYNQSNIKPLGNEEQKKLASGEMTEEEAINLILGKDNHTSTPENEETELSGAEATEEKPEVSTAPEEQPQPKEPYEETNGVDEKIGEYIAKVYMLKAKYNGLIEDANYNIASDFYSLPKEQQTKDNKYEMGITFMNNLLDLQKQCDGEINTVLNELETFLTENNMSTELIDYIKEAYEKEKELKKAYFINKYKE